MLQSQLTPYFSRKSLLASAASLLCVTLAGCNFVSLTDAGSQVAQYAPTDIAGCTFVGTVSSKTQDKVVVSRGNDKVREELIVIARNRAADLGATGIVAERQDTDGQQDFKAYRCD